MTDFTSEFQKVFGNSCPPQTDWNTPRFFDALRKWLLWFRGCFNGKSYIGSIPENTGFEVYYFVKEHDTKFDPLYGEDQLENVKRRFALQVYTENVPQLQKQYQLQGMIYTETVTVQCTIQHFLEASKYDWKTENPNAYDSIVPKIGDLMYFRYSDLYYEVINVKDFAEGTTFLSTPITYQFILRVWRNSHENVDELNVNDDNMEHIRSYVELGETFNVDMDMGKHENQVVTPEQEKTTSTVKASGDALSINDTVKWENLRKSKNNDAMDVLYNPNKDYDKFEEYINGVDNVIGNYKDTFNEIGDKTSELAHETTELENQLTDLQNKIETNVNTINKQMDDFDNELKFDIETIQYTDKKA